LQQFISNLITVQKSAEAKVLGRKCQTSNYNVSTKPHSRRRARVFHLFYPLRPEAAVRTRHLRTNSIYLTDTAITPASELALKRFDPSLANNRLVHTSRYILSPGRISLIVISCFRWQHFNCRDPFCCTFFSRDALNCTRRANKRLRFSPFYIFTFAKSDGQPDSRWMA